MSRPGSNLVIAYAGSRSGLVEWDVSVLREARDARDYLRINRRGIPKGSRECAGGELVTINGFGTPCACNSDN